MPDSLCPPSEHQARCFAPIVQGDIRVLILGSLPGRASLKAGRYYAHPRNQFWQLMGATIQTDLSQRPYQDRLRLLLGHGIGLWDTVAQADRRGSLDSALRGVVANQLTALLAELPALRLIAFNGQKAAQLGARALAHLADPPPQATLPSSSPAFTLPLAAKMQAWVQAIGPALAR